jgi:hypothetical protein
MAIIKQEGGVIGSTTINGVEVPIVSVPTEIVVKNLRTNTEYDSEEAADADIADPNTETTQSDVQKSVKVKVAKLVDIIGLSGRTDG